ncbi:uncharacterized protein LOC116853090 isoform X2 [Odontomachus brunneus]|uniref:uncharacterized protein LOC116853090 isoform X2 n=1 Tax=Odontomachus brunneus TaxID=486640 RepID=UPI0013F22E55|nr:uncharacterized protein LOC116853090 isoform X2 [Odontomachus brunneus]
MKTVAIISSVFALATVIYSADPIALQKFRKNYKNCAQMMNVSTEAQIQVALCAVIQEGDANLKNGFLTRSICNEHKRNFSDAIMRRLEAEHTV